mgnify:CR=1 FL=1
MIIFIYMGSTVVHLQYIQYIYILVHIRRRDRGRTSKEVHTKYQSKPKILIRLVFKESYKNN